jgi:hypothetical protein
LKIHRTGKKIVTIPEKSKLFLKKPDEQISGAKTTEDSMPVKKCLSLKSVPMIKSALTSLAQLNTPAGLAYETKPA